MLFHGLISILAMSGALTREPAGNDPLNAKAMEMPAFTLPRPETYAGNWRASLDLWVQSGKWSFAQPELGLATQCMVSMEIGEGDRLRMLENKNSILHFRFPGGRVRLLPQMLAGDLGSSGLYFWTQEFGATFVKPEKVREASFTFSLENPVKGGLERGIPMLTVEASGFEGLRGTRLTHMWCQGEFLKLETLQRVFEAPGKTATETISLR